MNNNDVVELVEAASGLLLANWPALRDGMDWEILPVGVKRLRAALEPFDGVNLLARLPSGNANFSQFQEELDSANVALKDCIATSAEFRIHAWEQQAILRARIIALENALGAAHAAIAKARQS